MAKKKKPVKKSQKPRHRPITQAEYLETLIKFSRRAITGHGSGVDEFFEQQAKRLEKQLEDLRSQK